MKFLLYSQSGEGSQILSRIESEGNEVGLFIKDPIYKTVFDGILPKVDLDFVDKDTIIIFDMSGNGSVADEYRKKGHFVYGASSFADKLENDREFGFKVMKDCGIKIPDYKEFADFNSGKEYIQQARKRLVFKPSGSMPCKLTYCAGKENYIEELIAYMDFVEKHYGKHIDSFILQDFIEGSVISSEFFSCGRYGFLPTPNHTVEVKKSMNDDLGPSTGCSGNITWVCDYDKIIEQGVAFVEEECINEDYVGQIDLNTVVNDEGVYGLEWTPRFGYDATPTFLTLLEDDFGKFFSDIARGNMNGMENIKFKKEFAGSVRITIPPYPAESEKDTEQLSPNKGIPIQNYDQFIENLYFYEVCAEDDKLFHSGGTGVIACAMGLGDESSRSLEQPYEILKNLCIPDKQYRTDLSEVLEKMVKESLQYV